MPHKMKAWCFAGIPDGKWIIVDGRKRVRLRLRYCLHSEARAIAALVLNEESHSLRALTDSLLSPQQRLQAQQLPWLTPTKCRALVGGVELPIDREKRQYIRGRKAIERAEAKATPPIAMQARAGGTV